MRAAFGESRFMKERSLPNMTPIPDKLYFKIGEVSKIAGVPTHVLRFWETEFQRIRPRRTASGQRLYTRKEVELVLEIKRLLYQRRFTINGARQHLRIGPGDEPPLSRHLLDEIRTELNQLRRLLD
jgi:DNA-binding transcriptional MerR regulator